MKLVADYLDNSAFHSVFTSFTVDYGYLAVEEVIEDMNWLGWTDMAEEIGTRGSYWQSTFLY